MQFRPHIIYLHQYYRTPEQGGSLRSYHFCKALIANGYRVDMVTSHDQSQYKKHVEADFTIHYLPAYYHSSQSYLRRVWAYCSYMVQAWVLCVRLPWGLCYASSTPLTVGFLALLLCRVRHIPYIFEIRDLWPEAPIKLGIVQNKVYIKILFWLQKNIYSHARATVALSPNMQQAVVKSDTSTPCYMIPNISDCDFFGNSISKGQPDAAPRWPADKYIICYTGTLNYANGLDALIDLATWFDNQGLGHTHFVVAGEGFFGNYLKQKAEKLHLNNITFLGNVDKFVVRQLLQDSALAYISFLDIEILGSNSPNKFFDALAASLPVCINVAGWIKPLIEQQQCGFYADSSRPDLFFENYKKTVLDADMHKQMRTNAKKLALSAFDLSVATKKFLEVIYTYSR